MRRLDQITTPYNDVDVWENNDGSIDFNVIGATHATWHPVRLMTGHAWDAITAAVLMHPGPLDRLLMLGLGGGTVLRQLRAFFPDMSITAVEIDPEMVRLARQYMALDRLNIDVVTADAYKFLETNRTQYDVLVDDLYRSGDRDVERPAPVDAVSIARAAEHLTPAGTLIMNFVVAPGHHRLHRIAKKAFLEHFASVRGVRPPLSHNEVLAGTRGPLPLHGPRHLRRLAQVLTDPDDQKFWEELRSLKLR